MFVGEPNADEDDQTDLELLILLKMNTFLQNENFGHADDSVSHCLDGIHQWNTYWVDFGPSSVQRSNNKEVKIQDKGIQVV